MKEFRTEESKMMFEPFPKIPRLMDPRCVISEKIDGTNAQVVIRPAAEMTYKEKVIARGVDNMTIYAGSRKRWITPEDDNFGFAKWVWGHADELIAGLGEGQHFGEWWGSGIQRRYGLDHKRFSLFNSGRWSNDRPECCHVVPVLYSGPFSTDQVELSLDDLGYNGSHAVPGYMNPEGVVIYHTTSRQLFKKTLDGDGHKANGLREK